jgi:hypothetical protein
VYVREIKSRPIYFQKSEFAYGKLKN